MKTPGAIEIIYVLAIREISYCCPKVWRICAENTKMGVTARKTSIHKYLALQSKYPEYWYFLAPTACDANVESAPLNPMKLAVPNIVMMVFPIPTATTLFWSPSLLIIARLTSSYNIDSIQQPIDGIAILRISRLILPKLFLSTNLSPSIILINNFFLINNYINI